jgi:hypothetical protein
MKAARIVAAGFVIAAGALATSRPNHVQAARPHNTCTNQYRTATNLNDTLYFANNTSAVINERLTYLVGTDCREAPIKIEVQQVSGNVWADATQGSVNQFGAAFLWPTQSGTTFDTTSNSGCIGLPHASTGQWYSTPFHGNWSPYTSWQVTTLYAPSSTCSGPNGPGSYDFLGGFHPVSG